MICGYDNFAGVKVFEFSQDTDDLRLRQFCSKKVFEYFRRGDEEIWQRQVLKLSQNIFRARIKL